MAVTDAAASYGYHRALPLPNRKPLPQTLVAASGTKFRPELQVRISSPPPSDSAIIALPPVSCIKLDLTNSILDKTGRRFVIAIFADQA